MSEEEQTPEEEKTTVKTVAPKWFWKLVFVVCSKLAAHAMKKAGIEPDQHKEAQEGTDRIKDAAEDIKDEPVNIEDRDPDDIFNNS